MNDCIDKRVVDGRGLGYNSRDCFGIRIEDASISERCKEKKCVYQCCNFISFHHDTYNVILQEVEYGSWLMAEMNYIVQASILYILCSIIPVSLTSACLYTTNAVTVETNYWIIKSPFHTYIQYLPSPGDESDACIGRPGKHKHYDDHKGNLGQLPFSLDGLLLDQGRLPHLRPQLLHISVRAKGNNKGH